jgi:hypothetical protein
MAGFKFFRNEFEVIMSQEVLRDDFKNALNAR